MPSHDRPSACVPRLTSVGLSGMLVSFSETLTEAANRAALAFRDRVERAQWPGVDETTTALTSVYIGFDPGVVSHQKMTEQLHGLLKAEDWAAAPLPRARRRWQIPTVFGTSLAPQLGEASQLAGMTEADAIAQLSTETTRVLTLGFAPGQPYLGILPAAWDIDRQSGLTPRVPEGALGLAIRQMVLFTTETPTGWRHIAQTAFRGFRAEADDPFALRPGDEVMFPSVTPDMLAQIRATDKSGDGGATWHEIA